MRLLMSLIGLLVLGAVPPPMAPVSAIDLLHEYWNLKADADAKYNGKQIVVTGLVGRVHDLDGMVLDLQVDERSYFVRCKLEAGAVPAALKLKVGQLVAVRGEGQGAPRDRPALSACALSWVGDEPDQPPSDAPARALQAALSVNLCRFADLRRQVMQLLEERATAKATPADLAAYRDKVMREIDEAEAKAKNAVVKAKVTPLPCDHPFVAIVGRCLRDLGTSGPDPIPWTG
jgi:hypothetical protein